MSLEWEAFLLDELTAAGYQIQSSQGCTIKVNIESAQPVEEVPAFSTACIIPAGRLCYKSRLAAAGAQINNRLVHALTRGIDTVSVRDIFEWNWCSHEEMQSLFAMLIERGYKVDQDRSIVYVL